MEDGVEDYAVMVNDEAVSTENSLDEPLQIRKFFPEVWIWESIDLIEPRFVIERQTSNN